MDEAVCDEDAEDFLDAGCVVGAGVVEEGVAVALGVCAEVVGIFLVWLMSVCDSGIARLTCAMVRACCSKPML